MNTVQLYCPYSTYCMATYSTFDEIYMFQKIPSNPKISSVIHFQIIVFNCKEFFNNDIVLRAYHITSEA
jgi:hypothetical protein